MAVPSFPIRREREDRRTLSCRAKCFPRNNWLDYLIKTDRSLSFPLFLHSFYHHNNLTLYTILHLSCFLTPFFVNFFHSFSGFLMIKLLDWRKGWVGRRWWRRRNTIALSLLQRFPPPVKCAQMQLHICITWNNKLLGDWNMPLTHFGLIALLYQMHLKCGTMNESSTIAGILQCLPPAQLLYCSQRNMHCATNWNFFFKCAPFFL